MGTERDDEIEIDLLEIYYLLKKRIWAIILAIVAGATIALVVTVTMMEPIYESSSMLYILNKSTSLTSLADIQLGTQLTKDYKILVTSRPVTSQVIENLDLNLTHEELVEKVEVGNPTDTRILTITVKDTNPMEAKAIADEMAKVSAARMGEIMDTTPPNIVEEAHLPEKPVSPSIKKNVALGGAGLGCVVIFIIVVAYLMNDTLKNSDDIEKYLGLNTLGFIPEFEDEAAKNKKKKKKKAAKGR